MVAEKFDKELTPLQKNLASVIFEGKDLLYPTQSYKNAQQIRELYLLRALDQIYRYIFHKHRRQ
jgi:hypothetical protein